MAKRLTDKQEKFIQELLKGKSQRESFKIAYPNSKNWKDNAVDARASGLFHNDKVQLRFNDLKDRLAQEAEDECIIEAKDVLRELGRIAFADVTDYANIVTKPRVEEFYNKETMTMDKITIPGAYVQDVELKDTSTLPKSMTAAIKSIKSTKYGISLELYPKDKSLELLGKTLGMFMDKLEVKGQVDNPFQGLSTEELKKLIENG